MADKTSNKKSSSIKTRHGSKGTSLSGTSLSNSFSGSTTQQSANSTNQLETSSASSSTTVSNQNRLSKKRKSTNSLLRTEISTSNLSKTSSVPAANSSKQTPQTATASPIESKEKHKKIKLNINSPEAGKATSASAGTSKQSDHQLIEDSSAKKPCRKFNHLRGKATGGNSNDSPPSDDEDEEATTPKSGHKSKPATSRLSSSRSKSTEKGSSSSGSSHQADLDEADEVEPESDDLQVEEEASYQHRLRRASSSSSKSNVRSATTPEVPHKKQKLTKPTTSKTATKADKKSKDSLKASEKSQSNIKETGSCTSSASSSHPTSTSRRSQPQASQPQETTVEQTATAGSSSQEATKPATSLTESSSIFAKIKANMSKEQQSKSSKSGGASANPLLGQSSAVGLVESADSSDNDTSAEFSRLTDLLQARGLPSHIVNAFGSKVQQFLHRTMSSGISSRSQNLISSLQQHDESLKLTALTELCQMLVMGNEDTLIGFPIKQAVPLLLQCMSSESENFDLMNHACRALTYMMESLPRSSSIIAEGIGTFLEKLQVIQCMDVAEQALTALEILSRRHSKQILNATQSGSVNACLTYIDFFSMTAQRNALQITANCCQNMIRDEFANIKPSLPILAQRLTHSDKKSVESVCTVFARLVENFQQDSEILQEIANHNVLTNMQQLLVIQPSVVSSSMFVTILHTIYLMCANCTVLASQLIENNISNTFITLLVGPTKTVSENDIEILTSRSTQELYEIVAIIGELMPSLPETGIFSIDATLHKTSAANHNEHVVWQWKDERETWRPYTPADSRLIEAAFSHEEHECILNTMSRSYILDFSSMLQINEETGTARPIARKIDEQPTPTPPVNNNNQADVTNKNLSPPLKQDSRLSYLTANPKVYAEFVSSLFAILYAVYSSSAGPSIKHRCLRALLRMIYYSGNDQCVPPLPSQDKQLSVLHSLLKNLPISSQIASMLASADTKILVSALQICEILMQKMPDVFSVYFLREGVIHQIDRLIETSAQETAATVTPLPTPKVEEPTSSAEKSQRKTRSSTAAAAVTTIPVNDAAATDSNSAKRKTRVSHTSKHVASSSGLTTSRSNQKSSCTALNLSKSTSGVTDTATSQSGQSTAEEVDNSQTQSNLLTSNTAKYFRNVITKMHGASNSAAQTTSKTQTAQQQPATTQHGASQAASARNDYALFGSDPLWSQLKAAQQSTASFLGSTVSYPGGKAGSSQRPPKSATLQQQISIDYNAINANKEKVRRWIYEQAKQFRESYFPQSSLLQGASADAQLDYSSLTFSLSESPKFDNNNNKEAMCGLNVLNRLKQVVPRLDIAYLIKLNESPKNDTFSSLNKINENYLECLGEIGRILNDTDISSFEMIHSGLIEKLLAFLSVRDTDLSSLEKALNQGSINYSAFSATHCSPSYVMDLNEVIKNDFKVLRCKQFLNIFSHLPFSYYCSDSDRASSAASACNFFAILLGKLHNCVNQLEQFAVRVHDVPALAGGCSGGKNAIKFFNTHQLKCLLRRHSSCPSFTPPAAATASATLSQWKGGPVKVDPLAAISTIEKYLMCRGMHIAPTQTSSSTAAAASGFLSSSFPSSTAAQAPKSLVGRFSKASNTTAKPTRSLLASAGSKKTTAKSASSRLYLIKAAAEMATDRFKKKPAKVPKKAAEIKVKMEPIGAKSKKTNTAAAKPSKLAPQIKTEPAKTSSKKKSGKTTPAKSKNSSFTKPMDLSGKSTDKYVPEAQDDEEDEFQVEEHFPDEGDSTANEEYAFNQRIDDLFEDDEEHPVDEDDEDNEDDELGEDDEFGEEHEPIDDEEIDDEDDEEKFFGENEIGEEINESDEIDEDDDEEEDEDDDDEDGDIESAMNAILGTARSAPKSESTAGGSALKNFYLSSLIGNSSSSSNSSAKIELLINETVLPSNMSVYQAIKLYSNPSGGKDADNDTDSLFNSAIWSKVHLVHYRIAKPTDSTTSTGNDSSSEATKRITRNASQSILSSTSGTPSKAKPKGKSAKSLDTDSVEVAKTDETPSNINTCLSSTAFFNSMTNKWAGELQLTVSDQAMNAISLLRLLNTLNRHWSLLYADLYAIESLQPACKANLLTPTFLVSTSQFVNTKLTAKANRQLQDPLVIMTGHLPKWLPELMQTCSFLFPFKTRLMYFYVSSLDRDRAMQKLFELNADLLTQNDTAASSSTRQHDRFVPKLDKKKRTISRSNDLIKQTDAILNDFSVSNANPTTSSTAGGLSNYAYHKPALLEIQYEGEVGTGLGPTLEFYALVSSEVQKCEYEMWRGEKTKLQSTGQNEQQLFYFSPSGLFPAPLITSGKLSSKQQTHVNKIKMKFRFLGKFMAKAVIDFRVLDIQLSFAFYKWIVAPNSLCEADIKYIDAQLFSSIESLKDYVRQRRHLLIKIYKISTSAGTAAAAAEDKTGLENQLKELEKTVADLDLDFTLPGYSFIELKKGGKDLLVTLDNLEEYLKLIVDWTLISGVQQQLESFKEGFETILPIACLQQFYPEELENLFCGSGYHEWTIQLLNECTRCDHGYTHDSKAVKYLFEIMCSFDPNEQRQFLQFITGSPRLPIGGLRSLVPPLTIVRKSNESASSTDTSASSTDVYLPSVMTCVNYLKLPDYSSVEAMKDKLLKAMQDGQLSFHLS